ncbi:PPE family protein [Mycobacterium sp.]|uniref:PPE family protein n=1 Tax=Mycobacterium sp. TaxID=1785 RepID=UPI00127B930A|nr:PPE family protein [Mycobacterium sp.]KAA8966325.1 MAG: PPE family protein [Mycobacterium sp.]
MDFGALPPEVNSALMYTGPGSAPMMAAASAWNSLGAELSSAASAYESVISTLSGEEWLGPASAAMAAAAAPYLAWLNCTATAAEQAAAQAAASAGAFEAAFAMTVPPPVIAANRAQLAALVATNFLGQNTPAIAATEAHYAEMWAQDAAAMYGYAGSSASAGVLRPLTSPTPTTNPAGLAGQAAAVSTAGTQTGLSQLVANLPTAMQALASPLAGSTGTSAAASPAGLLSELINSTENIGIWNGAETYTGMLGNIGAWNMFAGITTAVGLANAHGAGIGGVDGLAAGLGTTGLANAAAPAVPVATTGVGAAPVLVSAGQASAVGGLSVPAAWSPATPAGTGSVTLAGTGWSTAAENTPVEAVPAGMPAVASGGRAGFGFGAPRYGVKPTVMVRPVVAG